MIAGLAARAAALAGFTPGEIVFTAVLSLARAAVTADTCCHHCGKRPTSENAPTVSLEAAVAALPPGRTFVWVAAESRAANCPGISISTSSSMLCTDPSTCDSWWGMAR